MSYIKNLIINDIEQGPLPLKNILANSLYYEACETDGGLVMACNKLNRDLGIKSFIYIPNTL